MSYVRGLIRLAAIDSFLLLLTSSSPVLLVSNKIPGWLQKSLQPRYLLTGCFIQPQLLPLLDLLLPLWSAAKDSKAFSSQKWVVLSSETLRPQKHLCVTTCSLTDFSYFYFLGRGISGVSKEEKRTFHILSKLRNN